MKTNITLGSIIIVLLFIIWGFNEYRKVQAETIREQSQAITISQQETQYYKTKEGQTIAQVNTLTASVKTMELVLGNSVKSLEEKFGPLKHLQNYVSAGIKSAGRIYTNIQDTTINDTIRAKKFDFSDNYLSLNCVMVNDSVNCPYTYVDSLEVAIVMNRNWRWYQFAKKAEKKKQGFDKWTPITKVAFKNPNSKATGVKSYIVK
jgi:hypothetical protein